MTARFRVLCAFPRRNGRNTRLLLDRLIEEMRFPIQRIQTDRGTEFFGEAVQMRLKQECIKFRPNPPRSPHLNGKAERSQLTDLVEFWARHSPQDPDINQRIEEWQFDYNWRRSHGGLSGRTPADRLAAAGFEVPLREEVMRAFDSSRERIRFSNWKMDQAVTELNRPFHSVGDI